MEYADEGDLLKYIKERKKAKKMFFELEIWKLLISLLHGLDYIHEKSIMHRDIKS